MVAKGEEPVPSSESPTFAQGLSKMMMDMMIQQGMEQTVGMAVTYRDMCQEEGYSPEHAAEMSVHFHRMILSPRVYYGNEEEEVEDDD